MEFIPVPQRDQVSTYRSLRSLFEKNITVNSISEVLASCNVNDQALQIRDQMVSKDYDVIGVEENGWVIGYVLRDDLRRERVRTIFAPLARPILFQIPHRCFKRSLFLKTLIDFSLSKETGLPKL